MAIKTITSEIVGVTNEQLKKHISEYLDLFDSFELSVVQKHYGRGSSNVESTFLIDDREYNHQITMKDDLWRKFENLQDGLFYVDQDSWYDSEEELTHDFLKAIGINEYLQWNYESDLKERVEEEESEAV